MHTYYFLALSAERVWKQHLFNNKYISTQILVSNTILNERVQSSLEKGLILGLEEKICRSLSTLQCLKISKWPHTHIHIEGVILKGHKSQLKELLTIKAAKI